MLRHCVSTTGASPEATPPPSDTPTPTNVAPQSSVAPVIKRWPVIERAYAIERAVCKPGETQKGNIGIWQVLHLARRGACDRQETEEIQTEQIRQFREVKALCEMPDNCCE